MEYRIHKSDLQNNFLAEILQVLAACYGELQTEVYVVGAVARNVALKLHKIPNTPRGTMDLDVAVALKEWSQFEQLTNKLLQCNFEKAPEKQRFYYRKEGVAFAYKVDIVPFGLIAENEKVAWPPDGSPVMSVKSFDDVMNSADKVIVDDVFSFRMASLSGQFLIKLDAWCDRHLTTRKDAADMFFILQNVYVAYALSCDKLPPEINIDAENFNLMVAGAEWIASDLKKILTNTHRRYYSNLLFKEIEKEEESELLNDLLDMSDGHYYVPLCRALKRIAQILAI